MTSYFKYTSGEAFTLNNSDYVGYFHIVDGVPYTEKADTEDMLELTPKETFMSKFYMELGSFNTVYKNIQQLQPYYTNVFDILNKQGLDTALESLDDGNVTCFKGNILGNPVVYRFEENGGFYYGLDSPGGGMEGHNEPSAVDELSASSTWSFLDEVKTATFTVNTIEEFRYFCSTGIARYVLEGNFSDYTIPLTQFVDPVSVHIYSTNPAVLAENDYIYNIYNDVDAKQLFETRTDTVDIYDIANFEECGNFLLLDRIQLSATSTDEYIWNLVDVKWNESEAAWNTRFFIHNPNNPQFIKFGGNIRTSLHGKTLTILNKHSAEVFFTMSLTKYDIDEALSIDVRNVDDNILLLYKSGSTIRLLQIDGSIGEVLRDDKLESIRILDGFRTEFEPTVIDLPNYTVKFSDVDSDMFMVYNTNEYQTRFLSGPTYPAGRLELNELYYLPNFTWDQAFYAWNLFPAKWNYAKMRSNNYITLVSTEILKNNKMYMLHQNFSRLYAMNQPPNDRFHNSIPLNMVANFNGSVCTESTFGLYFNNAISNIVKDTVNMALKSYGKFEIHERMVYVRQLEDLVSLTNDLYLNGNETFNVLSLQRIFLIINNIQASLIPVSVEN